MIKNIMAVMAITLFAFSARAQDKPSEVNPDSGFGVAVYEWINPETELSERFFYYVGAFTVNTSDAIEDAIARYPGVKKIALHSPGGVASEADEVGNIFSEHGIQTWVPKGRFCMSACANAFIGGRDYKISGILGFHASWVNKDIIEQLTTTQVNQLLQQGQVSGVRDVYYWFANGFSIQLPFYINANTSPSNFLVFLSTEKLMEYYVRDDENPDNDTIYTFMKFNDALQPVVWNERRAIAYAQDQLQDVVENGASVNLVEVIHNGFAETDNEEE